MALVRDLFIWLLVSLHILGGAAIFRRLFPRESPWFGFLVPPLVVVVLLNFIEHFVALPSLGWLLPITVLGCGYAVARSGYSREELRLPSLIFLVAFGYYFLIRCIDPAIHSSSDGAGDLTLIANFCHGERLPPTDSWMPPLELKWYYTLQHYAASVLKRLLNVDVGTAYNTALALLVAFTVTTAAAIAHRLSGQRAWVAWTSVFLVVAAFTGSSAYLWLTMPNATGFLPNNLAGGYAMMHDGINDHNPLWHFLGFDSPLYTAASPPERLELQVAGFWGYRDEYHPNSSGHFLTLFAVFSVIELLRREERTNWPWIMSFLLPPLIALSSVWLIFADTLLLGGALLVAAWVRLRPAQLASVIVTVVLGLVLMWPSLADLASSPQSPPFVWTKWAWHTPLTEYLLQWWPVLILWLLLFAGWKRLPLGVRVVHLFLPLFLLLMEMVTLEDGRYNTVEKMWGAMYSLGLLCFFPLVAVRTGWLSRAACLLILLCGLVSWQGWLTGIFRWAPWGSGAFQLQGDRLLQADGQKGRIENLLRQYRDATILPGKADGNYSESALPPIFTGNRCYIACYYAEERFGHYGQQERTRLTADFYDGKLPASLAFLRNNNIAAAVIWPDDAVSDETLAALRQKLAPAYDYLDCRGDGAHNAGVFMGALRPRQP